MNRTFSSLLSTAQQQEVYYFLYLARRFDERMVSLWKQGRGLGTSFSSRGHEAVSVGAGYALEADDVAAPMHRNVGTHMVRGVSPGRLLANYLGKETGATRGRDANIHGVGDLGCNLIGFISHIPQSMSVALGAAMSFKYRDQPRAALTVCGGRSLHCRDFPRNPQHGRGIQGSLGSHSGKQSVCLLHACGPHTR